MTKNLNIMTPINDLGYGIAGYNTTKSLHELGVEISLFPIGDPQITLDITQSNLIQLLASRQTSFDVNAPCLKIWHEFSMAERIGSGPLFSYSFFEVNKFDERKRNHLKSCDGIIVSSEWAKEVAEDQLEGGPLIHVAPLGVNSAMFSHHPLPKSEKCIFLNCGKWEMRKGHDLLLSMFLEAFPSEEDVELWMMPSNPFISPEETAQWEAFYKQDLRVRILERVHSHDQVAGVMTHATCGVFPSRAEGWNLELLEMMAMGKPVIATNYSAHTEFCTEENCHLVTPPSLEQASDGKWFDGSAEWASIGEVSSDFSNHMRSVYEEWKGSDTNPVNESGIQTAKEFSWNNTAASIQDIIFGENNETSSSK